MTNEEIEQAYHQEMKERLFMRGHSEMNNPILAREIFLKWLEIGKREAVEKTKQACWDFFLNQQGCFTPSPDSQEYLVLDNTYEREEFEDALNFDKIMSPKGESNG